MSPVFPGTTLRLKVCNNLTAYYPTADGDINSTYGTQTQPMTVGAGLSSCFWSFHSACICSKSAVCQLNWILKMQTGGISVFKDVNILANHLHGFYGNPGTDNVACSNPLPSGGPCYRGDNIFEDIMPGACNFYQYDFASLASPGALW